MADRLQYTLEQLQKMHRVGSNTLIKALSVEKGTVNISSFIPHEENLTYAFNVWGLLIGRFLKIDGKWHAAARTKDFHKGIYVLYPLTRCGRRIYITMDETDLGRSVGFRNIVVVTLPYSLD